MQTDRYTFYMDQTKEAARLRSIGEEYYEACFGYELSVCSGRTKEGEPVPINKEEHTKVNAHARKMFRTLCSKHQLTNRQMMKALRYARRSDDVR